MVIPHALVLPLVYLALALFFTAPCWVIRGRGFRTLAALALMAWAFSNYWTITLGWDEAPIGILASDIGIAVATARLSLSGPPLVCRIIVALYGLRFLVQVLAVAQGGHYDRAFYGALNLLYVATLLALSGGAVAHLAGDRAVRRWDRGGPRLRGRLALGGLARRQGPPAP